MDYGRNSWIDLFSVPEGVSEKFYTMTLSERLENVYAVIEEESEAYGIPVEEHPSGMWAKGCWIGDIHRVLSERFDDDEAIEAAERLCKWLGHVVGDPRAVGPLKERLNRGNSQPQLVLSAVHIIDKAAKVSQRIRLGKDYVLDGSGSPAWRIPDDQTFYFGLLEEWIKKELRNAIEADLLHQDYPSKKSKPSESRNSVGSHGLPLLPPQLGADQVESFLHKLRPRLSPMEVRILPYALEDDPRLTHRQIAERVGSTKRSVAQMRHRIREKAWKLYESC